MKTDNGSTLDPLKGTELLDQSLTLLSELGFRPLLYYLAGACPFFIMLIYTYSELVRYPWMEFRLQENCTLLTVLYMLMKLGHYKMSQYYLQHLVPREESRIGLGQRLNGYAKLLFVSSLGLVAIPLSLPVLLPFYPALSFFTAVNCIPLDELSKLSLHELFARCSRFAGYAPRQNIVIHWFINHWLLSLPLLLLFFIQLFITGGEGSEPFIQFGVLILSALFLALLAPFSFFVAVNIGLTIYITPLLIHILTGWEVFAFQHFSQLFSPMFFLIVWILTYLCLDPVLKVSQVLRVFHYQSQESGADLFYALKHYEKRESHRSKKWSVAMLLLFFMLCSWGGARAVRADQQVLRPSDTIVGKEELHSAIKRVMSGDEYTYYSPDLEDESEVHTEHSKWATWLKESLINIVSWLWLKVKPIVERVWEWIRYLLRKWEPKRFHTSNDGWMRFSSIILLLMVIIIAVLLTMFLIRLHRRRKQGNEKALTESTPITITELEDEQITEEKLEGHNWFAIADSLAAEGKFRLAVRALYLGVLAHFSSQGLITPAKYKTDKDYFTEVTSRGITGKEIISLFAAIIPQYQAVWYGSANLSGKGYNSFVSSIEMLTADETIS